MFLRDLYASLRRRWYFVVAGVLLTAALAAFAYREVPVEYKATGSVALVPPATAVISGDNPFLYMGGLEQALGVLTVKLNSPSAQRPILDRYPGVEYATTRDPSTNGPIVFVSVTGTTAENSLGALRQVLSAVPENLTALQDALSLSQEARMTSMSLAQDDKARINDGPRTRIILMLIAAGAAGSLLVTGQLDKILLRRRAGRGVRRSDFKARSAGQSHAGALVHSNSTKTVKTTSARMPVPPPTASAPASELPSDADRRGPGQLHEIEQEPANAQLR